MEAQKRICILTCPDYKSFEDKDDDFVAMCGNDKLIKDLETRGAVCEKVSWDSTDCEWQKYDVIICRSPYDYTTRPDVFSDWLKGMEMCDARMFNKPDQLVWNMNKEYLIELKEYGIDLPETIVVSRCIDGENVPELSQIMRERKWKHACVKPTIGGMSINVLEIFDPVQMQNQFEILLKSCDVIIQEYEHGYKKGETCLVFFDGQYSHAVKKPHLQMPGFEYVDADEDQIKLARDVISYLKEPPLIARVDIIRRDVDGHVTLGEIELLDPVLYLTNESSSRLADLILQKCS